MIVQGDDQGKRKVMDGLSPSLAFSHLLSPSLAFSHLLSPCTPCSHQVMDDLSIDFKVTAVARSSQMRLDYDGIDVERCASSGFFRLLQAPHLLSSLTLR